MTRARGLAAPPPPSGQRLRYKTTRHLPSSIRQTQPSTTTDAKWGHFKPSRRGQCKPSFSVERLTQLDFGKLAQLDSRATEAAFAEQAWHELHSGEDIVMPRSTDP
jgi:hypothetical protein